MSILKWGWLLVLPVFLVGCGTTPLEGDLDEVPADFFFRYVTENAIDVSAGVTGEETGEPAPDGVTPVDPPPEATAPPASGAVPSHLEVTVNVDGVVNYEAAYLSPRPARKSGEAKLDREGLLRIVNALRAAKPFHPGHPHERVPPLRLAARAGDPDRVPTAIHELHEGARRGRLARPGVQPRRQPPQVG